MHSVGQSQPLPHSMQTVAKCDPLPALVNKVLLSTQTQRSWKRNGVDPGKPVVHGGKPRSGKEGWVAPSNGGSGMAAFPWLSQDLGQERGFVQDGVQSSLCLEGRWIPG
jgi:hypothetical protein